MSLLMFLTGIVFIFLYVLPGTHSWGKEGHYITCKIAEGLLSREASEAVKSLLPEYANGDLASVCSWPDEVSHRAGWRWSSPLHYVDTPDFRCNYDYCRDCHDFARSRNRCVTGAIYNYSAQLSTYKNSKFTDQYNLTEALLFLSHFVGDIHQPLHCGFLGDEGGNTIILHWYRRKSNLHHVWDTLIIETALKKYNMDLSMMIEDIRTSILEDWPSDVPAWESCGVNQTVCPNWYAAESISLACKFVYKNASPGSTLGDDYFFTRMPHVRKRLAQGGVRLAATLNRIFIGGYSLLYHLPDDIFPECSSNTICDRENQSAC
ncbi:S1/P1 nuclease protein [Dioscorea alata]|nr:S1/P1 nuclease protein [Dioscorea alata]KAH7654783.1 S1/P1 nuclease protein [Dioscorea alata]